MAAENLRQIGPHDQLIEASDGRIVGVQIRRGQNPATRWATLTEGATAGSYTIQDPEGGVIALSEAHPESATVPTGTATTTVLTGAGEYSHYRCTVAAGNITIYDNTAASGKVLVPTTALALGSFPIFGAGTNGVLPVTLGVTVVLSGAATVYIGAVAT